MATMANNAPENEIFNRRMKKLKGIVRKLAQSDPNNPVDLHQLYLIEKGLLQSFSSSQNTPSHPAYSAMIETAVKKLVEEGSLITEKLILEYIKKTYEGLPWAHESYLKHHLAIVCKKGELVADLDGSYILPGNERRSRKKLLKLKLRSGKREVIEEGNVALEEVNELSDSKVGNQENASLKLRRGSRKRRRSYIFGNDEEDEEVVETRAVVGEQNKGNGSKMEVTEAQTEVLMLKGEDVECKSNEMDAITSEVHGLVDVVAGKSELQLDIVMSKEVTNQVVQVDHNLSEVRKEPDLLVLPGNVPKILPVVSEGELMELDDSHGANSTLESVEIVNESNLGIDGHRNCSGELMLSSVIVDPLAIVSKFESDAAGFMVEKSVLEGRKSVPSASELMIVPYKENSRNSAQGKVMIPLSIIIDPVIVCGLPNEQSKQPKKKLKVYPKSRRKRSKPGEESILASLDSRLQQRVETKINWKSQSPMSKTATPLENGSIKQLPRQKSSHPISGLEIISIEDEEPLRQVIEECGNLKRHGMQREIMKVASPLASSKADMQPPKKLPSLEKFGAMLPTMGEELAFTMKKEKQPHVQLRPLDKSCDYVEENASRKPSSIFLDGRGSKGSESSDIQQPVVPHSTTNGEQQLTQGSCGTELVTAITSGEVVPTDNLDLQSIEKERKRKIMGIESPSKATIPPGCPFKEVASLESPDGIGDQPKQSQLEVGDHNSKATTVLGQTTENGWEGPKLQCPQPFNSKEVFVSPSLLEKDNQQEEGPSEPTRLDASDNQYMEQETPNRTDLSSHGMEDIEGQGLHEVRKQDVDTPVGTIVNENIPVADPHPLQQNNDDQESPLKPIEATPVGEAFQHSHQLSEQPKNGQQKKRGRGRPRKSNKRTLIKAEGSLNSQPTSHQISDHQNKKKIALDDASDPSSLSLQEQERTTSATIKLSHQKNKMLTQDGRVRTRKQSATENVTANLLDPNLKEQELLSGTDSRDVRKQNKLLKKNVQRKSLKPIEPAPAPVVKDLYVAYMEELGLDPATGSHLDQQKQPLKEDGREEHSKQKEATAEDTTIESATLSLRRTTIKNKETEEHLPAPLSNQQSENKKLKRGSPCNIQKQGDKDDEAITRLSHEEKELSPNRQLRSNTRAESLEKGAIQTGATLSNLLPEQGDLKSFSHAVSEASSIQSQVDLKEIPPATSVPITPLDLELSGVATPLASMCVAGKSHHLHKDQNQPPRRITRSSAAAKAFLQSHDGKQHDLQPSDQKRLSKPTPDLVSSDHHCPDEESEDSKKKVHDELVELE